MFSKEDGETVVKYSRRVVEAHVTGEKIPEPPEDDIFEVDRGVFVTLTKGEELRGCIGIVEPEFDIGETIKRASKSSTEDPRMLPVSEDELDQITVEVTILTEPEKIDVEDPDEYLDKIKIGRDGLIVNKGNRQGLLLPQVPVDQGWNVEEFLDGTCRKAGIEIKAWREDSTDVLRFQGQAFEEINPNGKIEKEDLG